MRACNATRFPDACRSTLSLSTDLPQSPNPLQIIQSAFRASAENMNAAQSMIQSILSSPSENTNRSNAARICLDILTYSEHRTADAASAIWRGRTKDARAWASAALAYQYDCWSGLKYVNDTQAVNQTMSFLDNQTMSFLDTTLIVSTSNALSMTVAFDLYGNNTGLWGPPKTERDGFWESTESVSGVGGLGLSGGFPSGMAANATVCKDGGGCYDTVQAAVSAAPTGLVGSEKFVIYIKEGVYEEIVRVPYEKKNLVLVGDGMGKSVITGSLSTGLLGITTYNTATFGVAGDGFMAYGLTFENTAGPDAHQAVVFRSESDLSYIENCEFLGNQDTLYAHSLRQLYKSCRIQGNVDFIFGNSATIFQNCTILVCPRQVNPEKGETNTITAHGRTDPAQWTGFAFLGCIVNGTDEFAELYHSKPSVHKNYLGRPWKLYSRTVFINCSLGDVIAPAGWLPWSGDFALSTLYYGEYGNSGPGADLSQRVPWSSQIPANHIYTYSVQNFIQGDEWTTATKSL
ncbi:Probable pectinesterase/pectinesterase inhibitor 51 [Dionaea muscipula]